MLIEIGPGEQWLSAPLVFASNGKPRPMTFPRCQTLRLAQVLAVSLPFTLSQ